MARKKSIKQKPEPKRIYIQREHDTDGGSWLNAYSSEEGLEHFEDGSTVRIYELVDTRIVKKTAEFE